MASVNGKQERMVVHLEIGGQHYYYGNLKALCDHWTKMPLGSGTPISGTTESVKKNLFGIPSAFTSQRIA
jgi:hypothetical protein